MAIVLSAAALLAGLYYLGVYDLALIDRPESWEGNSKKLYAIWADDDTSSADGEETDGEEETGTPDNGPEHISTVEFPFKGRDRKDGANVDTAYPSKDELSTQGLYITDAGYVPGSSQIGKIDFSYGFPSEFSYRRMMKRTWVITKDDNGGMSTVDDTVEPADRPALYLYMGYIIYDDCGSGLYVIDRDGNIITEYDESLIPAFARDKNGNPLFYKTYGYYAEVPDREVTDEAGSTSLYKKGAYLTGFSYYTLSSWGGGFSQSDYVEERDGRGLNFDFPASYGLSDGYLTRIGVMSPKYTTYLNGKSALVNFMNWNYFPPYGEERPILAELIEKENEREYLEEQEKLKTDEQRQKEKEEKEAEEAKAAEEGPAEDAAEPEAEAEKTLKEVLPYSFAYNYREGYATVVTDDVDEDPKYEAEELRVINTAGNVMFTSRKKYGGGSLDAYLSDRFLLPLSKGEESIGHLYFDHGLMRVRKFTFDQFQLDEYGDFRGNDTDILVYPNGTEFPIPEGYTLKGYSDGVLTLERRGVYGYMRNDGKWIAEPSYTGAAAFHGGVGVLTRSDGKVGAVDTNGTVILPFKYEYMSNNSDGLIAAYSEAGGWELFGVFSN